jgi:hypothetical protein
MPGPRQPERGERKPYQARYRVNVGPARGMDDSHDSSTLPDEAVVEAINVRVHDGILVSRGGQEKISDQMDGPVIGMIELEEGGTTGSGRLFVSSHDELFTDACLGTPATVNDNYTLLLNLVKWLTYDKPGARIGYDNQAKITALIGTRVLETLAVDYLVAAGYEVVPGVADNADAWNEYDALITTWVATPAATTADFDAFIASGKGVALMGSYGRQV